MPLSMDKEKWSWWQYSLEKNIDNRKEAHRRLGLSAVNPDLCATCQIIDFRYLLFGDAVTAMRRHINEVVYLGTLQDIWHQALDGCPFCADIVLPIAHDILMKILQQPTQAPRRDHILVCLEVDDRVFPMYTALSHRSNGFNVCIKVSDGEERPHWTSALGIPVECSDYQGIMDSSLPVCVLDHELSAYRSLKPRVDQELCRSWFDVCCGQHEACRGRETSKASTSASSDTAKGSNPSFKLIDVKKREVVKIGDGNADRYATLSYVCGAAYTLCILQGSAAWTQDERGIWRHPLPTELPDTVEDALIVTGRLGLQYLWVDSICIAQDDEEEKHAQILAMHAIYSRADICIVAASGNDSRHGLPGVRESRKLRGSAAGVPLRTGRSALVGPVRSALHEIVKQYRWIRRAWTFQEIILAQRCLIFTETEAFFFCRQKTFKESLVENHDGSEREYWSNDAWEITGLAEITPSIAPLRRDGRFVQKGTDMYGGMVREYTQRELSHQEDGLNAFRGTESLIGEILGCETIAGCPVRLLVNCLAWELRDIACARDEWPLRRMSRGKKDDKNVHNDQHLIPLLPSWAWVAWKGAFSVRHQSVNIGSELKLLDPARFSPIPVSDAPSRYKFAITNGIGGQQEGLLKDALPVLARVSQGYFRTTASSDDSPLPPWLSEIDDLATGFVDITTLDGKVVGNCDVRGMVDPKLVSNGQEAVILQLAVQPSESGRCIMLLAQLHDLLDNQPALAQQLVAEAAGSKAVLQSFTQGPVERNRGHKKGIMPEECAEELVVPDSIPSSIVAPLVATRLGVGRIDGGAWRESRPETCLVFLV
ncbi:HET domain-containing protein [Aspergillus undulatus]|uniref:HET domain-containing protein n=1 Tax=Aspergillus undulatus TaxID=1810928 RepID=UPI003CCD3A39